MIQKPAKQRSKRLTRERVVEQALKLTRRQGIEFSMRDLGNELDVWPMAVYRHIENRDALLGEIVDAVLAEVLSEKALRQLNDRRGSSRKSAMRVCLHCYDVVVRYPGSAQLIVGGTTFSPNRIRLADAIIDFLVDLGLPPRRAAEILHSMSLMLFQAAALDQARQDGSPGLENFAAEALRSDSRITEPEILDVFLNTSLRERAERGLGIIFAAIEHELQSLS
ncbi:MAG: hypothetical protein AAGL66_09320 [Pseudomonadota bacterium]